MELRQLATFRVIAQTLSFSRTAGILNYAQSTVSTQIQSLEEELGVLLFDRLGKRVALTEAGQQLLTYSDKILTLVDEAQAVVSESDTLTGLLTVSAPETLCAYRLPTVLGQFQQRFPQVQLTFLLDPETDFHRPVLEGTVDVAFFMEAPFQVPNLIVETLVPEPLLLVAAPSHPLTEATRITFADLQDKPMIQTEAMCSYRRMFEQAALKEGVHLIAQMEFRSLEAIKQCVIAGLGVTFLPEIAVRKEIAQGQLLPLRWFGREFCIETQMVWHKDKWISPAMRAFINLAREMLGTN